jgi:nitrogen fixation-related uncharacterized protein
MKRIIKALWFRALITLSIMLFPVAFFGARWGWNTPLQDVKDDSPGTTIFILIISVIAAFLAGFYFVRGLDSRQYYDASELTQPRHESEIK